MPTYEYHCESNGRTVEVSHRMAEKLSTWGELCETTGRCDMGAAMSGACAH